MIVWVVDDIVFVLFERERKKERERGGGGFLRIELRRGVGFGGK